MALATSTNGDTTYYADDVVTLHLGGVLDVLRGLPSESIDAVVTSPPYWGLRDYDHPDQWGNEPTVEEYVERLRLLFVELRRLLTPSGVVWLNLGDSYAGKPGAGPNKVAGGRNVAPNRGMTAAPYKSLVGVPWRVALALQQDGWAVRNELVWAKPNPMPHPVVDRLNTAHETVFLLAPRPRYYFDLDAVRETLKYPDKADGSIVFGGHKVAERDDGTASSSMTSAYGAKHTGRSAERGYRPADGSRHTGGNPAGRNPGDVWSISTQPCPDAHFAVMPTELARRLVLTACPPTVCGDCRTPPVPRQERGGLDLSRPQARRATELAEAAGLTPEHIEAIRAVGISDAGQAQAVQSGTGRNRDEVQQLAEEAKAALGGYYREFLLSRKTTVGWEECPCGGQQVPGTVLDPFNGRGTTGRVARMHGRRYVGVDLNAAYLDLTVEGMAQGVLV